MFNKKYLLVVGFFILTSQLFAQELDDLRGMSLRDLMNIEITVASKTEEKLSDAPSSVIVFTQAEISNMGISNLEELLNFVPGFQITRDVEQGTANRISARGRSTALSESVLFLINGQRLNDLYTGGISILNRHIAVENIKQVEIIRGPGSALYGSNAFLGVVNIVTLDQANNLSISAGNLNSRNIVMNFSKGQEDPSFLISGFAKAFSDEGYQYEEITDIYGLTGNVKDPLQGFDGYVTLKYEKFSLYARHMERTLNGFLVFGALSDFSNYETTKQSSVNLKYNLELLDNFQLDIATGYSKDKWKTLAILIPKDIELAPGFALSENAIGGPFLESFNANFNINMNYRISSSSHIIGGFSYEQSAITEVMNMYTHHPITLEYQGDITEFGGDDSFNEKKTRHIFGAYLQAKQAIGDKLQLTVGVRFDNYNDFGKSLNPRTALIYSTPFDSKIKVMYGKAFRAPNFLELYDKNNPVDFGNQNLDAEKIQTIEFAYVQTLKMFQGTVTFFHNTIENMIVFGTPVVHPNNPLESPGFENHKENSKTNGLEFEFMASPLENLTINGTLTHFFEDNLAVSSNFASFMLNYQFPSLNFNLNGIFREKTEFLPDQDSYYLINATIQATLNPGLKLKINVKNLLDEKYYTVTSMGLQHGVMNRGRTYTLGLLYEL